MRVHFCVTQRWVGIINLTSVITSTVGTNLSTTAAPCLLHVCSCSPNVTYNTHLLATSNTSNVGPSMEFIWSFDEYAVVTLEMTNAVDKYTIFMIPHFQISPMITQLWNTRAAMHAVRHSHIYWHSTVAHRTDSRTLQINEQNSTFLIHWPHFLI